MHTIKKFREYHNLTGSFDEAGLKLEISKTPLTRGRGVEGIFQMDIRRRVVDYRRDEWFVIYPSNKEGIVIEVLNANKAIHQLVLMVKEPASTFQLRINKNFRVSGDKTIEEYKNNQVLVERKSPAATRKFLVGIDERQLFMATLPNLSVTTVEQAHQSLKRSTIVTAENRGKVIRQGEWFFVEASKEQKYAIADEIKKGIGLLRTDKYSDLTLGRLTSTTEGNPHVVQYGVRVVATDENMLALSHGYGLRDRAEVFVKGFVRHPDHKTVVLKDWHLVIRNREVANNTGASWID